MKTKIKFFKSLLAIMVVWLGINVCKGQTIIDTINTGETMVATNPSVGAYNIYVTCNGGIIYLKNGIANTDSYFWHDYCPENCSNDSIMAPIAGDYFCDFNLNGEPTGIGFHVYYLNQSSFSSADVSICDGESYFAGGNSQTISGTYHDTLSNVYGCDSIVNTNLTVHPTFNETENLTICEGDSVFVGGDWQTTTGIYYDNLQTVNGCDSNITTTLTVNAAYLVVDPHNICLGDSILVEGIWEKPITDTSYIKILTTSEGCDSTIETIAFVHQPLTAGFTTNVVGLNATFTNTSSNSTNSYWDFGDGVTSNEVSPTHTYEQSAFYHVCLTVFDSTNAICNTQAQSCIDIEAGNQESCAAAFTYVTGSKSFGVTFIDQSQGAINKWYWEFGDGFTSNLQHPTHAFAQNGYYHVKLTSMDTINNCADECENLLTIGNDTSVDCSSNFTYYVNNSNRKVWFTDQSLPSGTITNMVWNFGDGDISTTINPMHQFPSDGFYDVCLTITTSTGCTNTDCKTILVGNPGDCYARFVYTADLLNNKVRFTDISWGTTPNYWNWNFGEGGQSYEQNPTYTYSSPGTFMVNFHIKNLPGCNSHYNTVINLDPSILLASGFVHMVDSNNLKSDSYPVNFYGAAWGDPSQLLWNFGDGATDSTTWKLTHVYADSGSYQVCLTVRDPYLGEFTYCDSVHVGGLITGTSETKETEVSIYPNPSNGWVYTTTTSPSKIFVQNLLGETLQETNVQNSDRIFLSTPGMYLLVIQTDKKTITRKVIIN